MIKILLNYRLNCRAPIYIDGNKTGYEVDDCGNIYSHNKKRTKVILLSQYIDKDGYHRVSLYYKGKYYNRLVSRLVAMEFIPNLDNKPQVNHKDGNKSNNRANNLEWVTLQENIAHAWRTGLATNHVGEDHSTTVYSRSQIEKICEELVKNVKTMDEIANSVGVPYTIVKQIKNHVIWNNISVNYDFSKYNKRSKSSKVSKKILNSAIAYFQKGYSIDDVKLKYHLTYNQAQRIYKLYIYEKER